MATFELRRDALGQVVAVRAKVRRVGYPHLSKSFAVQGAGNNAAAVARAKAQARAWVATLEAGLGLQPARPRRAGACARANTAMQPDLPAAWRSASAAPSGAPPAQTDPLPDTALRQLLALEPDASSRSLLLFVLNTGLPVEALAVLRWQHVALAEKELRLGGSAGLDVQTVPLTSAALSALLGRTGRKYGLVFGSDVDAIRNALQACLGRMGEDMTTLYRAAAWRWLEGGLPMDGVAAIMGWEHLPLPVQGDPAAVPAPSMA